MVSHFQNIGHLLSGNVLSSLLALASLAIASRALDTNSFGILILVTTFVRLIERLVRFESWQPLIHFASKLEDAERDRLPRLYFYGILLDLGAALAAAVGSIAIAFFVGTAFGIGDEAVFLVSIYAISVLTNLTGWSTAALRMAGRFKQLAYWQAIGQVVRIPLALLCWWAWPTVTGFVVVWTIAQMVTSITVAIIGAMALREQGITNPLKESPRHLERDYPGFIRFAWSSNLSMTLSTMTQEADVLLVGALAGPSAAGFYHVAKRLAKVALRVSGSAQAVIYPELSRFWAACQFAKLRSLTLRLQFILTGVGILATIGAALIGREFVELVMGSEYGEVGLLLVAQLIAATLIMNAVPSRATLLAMGRPGLVLQGALVATVIFFATALLLIPDYGALGASMAHVAYSAFIAIWNGVAWLRILSLRIAVDAPGSS